MFFDVTYIQNEYNRDLLHIARDFLFFVIVYIL